MVLGRLVHYAADLALVSVVLAGVKRSSGFGCVGQLAALDSHVEDSLLELHSITEALSLALSSSLSPAAIGIPEGTPNSIANTYLGLGEGVFDYLQGLSYASPYFTRQGKDARK